VDSPIAPFPITVLSQSYSGRAYTIGMSEELGVRWFKFVWVRAVHDPLRLESDGGVLIENEGITWARGWSGEEVEALVVGRALL
jgi:hypothetical protein